MQATKNIVLLDDHVIIRNGLKELIEKLGPFKISQQFDNGATFIESFPQQPEPDLIILDVNMPGMNGDRVMEKLNEKEIKIPVLVLTVSEDEATIIKLFRLGARGYLMKNCKATELKAALNEIFRSGYYHNEFLIHSLQSKLSLSDMDENKDYDTATILNRLSPREREFLKLVCHEKEYTYEQIAEIMRLHVRTVDGYRQDLFNRFGIKSKTGLVLFILRNKLFEYL
jgi:two-component system invasion response regulator UvrY